MSGVVAGRMPVDGIDAYYESIGTGDPVVFLHGGFCSLEYHRPQLVALAARGFAVHAPERPGHGRTADRAGEMSYDLGVADTLAVMDALGLARAHVAGFSDGAVIGMMLAIRHPERVRSLVAISGNRNPAGYVEAEEEGGEDPVTRQLEHDYSSLSPDGPDHAAVIWEKLIRLWTTSPDIALAELAGITAPALFLAGDRDVIRTEHTVEMSQTVPGAQLGIVPGTGHMLMSERTELVVTLLGEFLASIR
ncbi:alpha/beta fold hydrolase [Nocardioides sp.]|uniref:alpha/beta fold hydrolase n=1 Tax=Nocardioides sp. TaxID=35761 RepID=UPI0039E31A27